MWWEALLWSLLAGVGGTLIGALIPISVHGKGEKVLSLLMAFTAGFMAALVFLDVLPESLEAGGKIWLTLLITLVGAAIVFVAGLLLDKKSGEHKHAPHIEAEIADEAEGKRDLYVGLSLAVALVLHNHVLQDGLKARPRRAHRRLHGDRDGDRRDRGIFRQRGLGSASEHMFGAFCGRDVIYNFRRYVRGGVCAREVQMGRRLRDRRHRCGRADIMAGGVIWKRG